MLIVMRHGATPDEIQKSKAQVLREMREEARLTAEIDRLERGEKTTRSPKAQAKRSARLEELYGRRADLLQGAKVKKPRAPRVKPEKPAAGPKPEAAPKAGRVKLTPEELAARREGKALSERQKKIDLLNSGQRPATKPKRELTPAVEAKEGELKLAWAKQRLRELDEALKTGKYRTPTKREVDLTSELDATRARADYLNRVILRRIEDAKPKNVVQKAAAVTGVLRGSVLGGDLGVVTRQG